MANTVPEVGGRCEGAVDLIPKLKRQFYYPLLLLTAVNKSPEMERRGHVGTIPPVGRGSSEIFHNFVNRVALLCQTDSGGDAVSACTILQSPRKVVYVFTSNSQEDSQLEFVAKEVTAILKMIPLQHETDDADAPALRHGILQAILALVKNRVERYLNKLVEHLEGCIASCQRKRYNQGKAELSKTLGRAKLTQPTLVDQVRQPELDKLANQLGKLASLAAAARELTGASEDPGNIYYIRILGIKMD